MATDTPTTAYAPRLSNTVALITGSSRGIGEAIARAYAAEGAKVVLISRKQASVDAVADSINQDHPGAAFARACHVGRLDQIQALMEWTEANVGLVNVLINNAGTNPYFGPMLGAQFDAWDKTFDVNLKGPFELTRQVAQRLMAAQAPGSVINVTSVLGMNASPLQGIYGMTKAAVISLTKTLAVELGPANIRVNAIAPGLIETRLSSVLINSPDLLRRFHERTPLGRHGQPDEISGLAVFLGSDASSFITGQTLAADGGYTIN